MTMFIMTWGWCVSERLGCPNLAPSICYTSTCSSSFVKLYSGTSWIEGCIDLRYNGTTKIPNKCCNHLILKKEKENNHSSPRRNPPKIAAKTVSRTNDTDEMRQPNHERKNVNCSYRDDATTGRRTRLFNTIYSSLPTKRNNYNNTQQQQQQHQHQRPGYLQLGFIEKVNAINGSKTKNITWQSLSSFGYLTYVFWG